MQNASTLIALMDVHALITRPVVNWLMDIMAAVLPRRLFVVRMTSTAALLDLGKLTLSYVLSIILLLG